MSEQLLEYLKGRHAAQDLQRWIADRGYADPHVTDFALNVRTRRLGYPYERDSEVAARRPLAVFAAVPNPPWTLTIDPGVDRIWEWLDANQRRYPPDPGAVFLPNRPQAMLDGLLMEELGPSDDRTPVRYLAVERSGAVELALTRTVYRSYNGRITYLLTPLVGYLWQFLGFVTDLYQTYSQPRPFTLLICLRTTQGAWLGGLADGWREPTSNIDAYRPECWLPGIQLRQDNLGPVIDPPQVEQLVHDLATQLDNAWGQRIPRCYIHPQREDGGAFALRTFMDFARR